MIKLGNKKVVPFKGDYKPVSIYKDSEKIFSPTLTTKTGTELEFKNTYNSECELIKVYGDSYQEHNRIAVKTGNIIQFDDHKGEYMVITSPVDCTVTRCGRNLIDVTVVSQQNSFSVNSDDNGGFIINNDGSGDHVFYFYQNSNLLPLFGQYNEMTLTASISNPIPQNTYDGENRVVLSTRNTDIVTNLTINNSTFIDNKIGITKTFPKIDVSASSYIDAYFKIKRVEFENYHLQVMLETGEIAHDFEPYIGERFEISANTPTIIPLLNGTNTIYPNVETNLNIQYLKSYTAENEDTDLISPTPNFPETINCHRL